MNFIPFENIYASSFLQAVITMAGARNYEVWAPIAPLAMWP